MMSDLVTASYNRYLPLDGTGFSALLELGDAAHTPFASPLRLELRLWTPQGAEVRAFRQVEPAEADLTTSRSPVTDQIGAYPLGTWAGEPRKYLLELEITASESSGEVRVAKAEFIDDVSLEVIASKSLIAEWIDADHMTVRMDRKVAQYTGQQSLADHIDSFLKAIDERDAAVAAAENSAAQRLAVDEAQRLRLSRIYSDALGSEVTQQTRVRLIPDEGEGRAADFPGQVPQ